MTPRAALCLLLLAAALAAPAAALAHGHDAAMARACDLCHATGLPALQVRAAAPPAPQEAVERLSDSFKPAHPLDPLLVLGPSRAPPA
jgi:hypothetical protein